MNDLPKSFTYEKMQALVDANLFSIGYDEEIEGYVATPNYRYCKPEVPRYIAAFQDSVHAVLKQPPSATLLFLYFREDDL